MGLSDATISRVKIRAVTLGLDFPAPEVTAAAFEQAAHFLKAAAQVFQTGGFEVQTTRLAGPELSFALRGRTELEFATWTTAVRDAAAHAGIPYFSYGRLPAWAHDVVAKQAASILAAGDNGFLSADLISGRLASVAMAGACAKAVKQLARTTANGYGNLQFAATAYCPPNIPFLPAAYHGGGPPQFSIALEAADVVAGALGVAGGVSELEDRLVDALEQAVAPVERIADELASHSGYAFAGIDLSPAPFPAQAASIGGAIESAGVDRFGAPGTLFLAAMVTRAIRRTRVRRCGFSGLMLPLLEDTVLARRSSECPPSMHELLLYSAVCGTGLDTVPLPEDVSEAELAGAFLDVAALSIALGGKPLTARLLPVPGASAGDMTSLSFEYVANTRVLPAAGTGASGILARGQ